MIATVLVLIQPTCMLVIGAYGDDDDCDRDEPKHHGMVNFFFEGDDQLAVEEESLSYSAALRM